MIITWEDTFRTIPLSMYQYVAVSYHLCLQHVALMDKVLHDYTRFLFTARRGQAGKFMPNSMVVKNATHIH